MATKKDKFTQSISQDTPIIQLVKYLYLVETHPNIALEFKSQMC